MGGQNNDKLPFLLDDVRQWVTNPEQHTPVVLPLTTGQNAVKLWILSAMNVNLLCYGHKWRWNILMVCQDIEQTRSTVCDDFLVQNHTTLLWVDLNDYKLSLSIPYENYSDDGRKGQNAMNIRWFGNSAIANRVIMAVWTVNCLFATTRMTFSKVSDTKHCTCLYERALDLRFVPYESRMILTYLECQLLRFWWAEEWLDECSERLCPVWMESWV